MSESVSNRFIRGAAWMLVAKLLERGLGLVSTLILARLLLPADFGLVSMAAPVIALVELLGAFGLDYALIRSRESSRAILDTAWSMKVCIGLVLGSVLVLVASPAAAYMREPRLESIVRWLALGVTIQSFENIGMVALRKNLQVGQDVALLLIKKLASLALAATAAVLLANYWALVIGTVGSRMFGVLVSYRLTEFRPRLSFAAWKELFSFSAWLFLNNVVSFVHHRASEIIIGRNLGSSQLAFYSVSMDLASTATGEAMSSISRVAFPAFSKISDQRERLAHGLQLVLAGLASFSLPIGTVIAILADPLITLLFGAKWHPAAPVLAQIAPSMAVIGVFSQISYVYMSLNQPRAATGLSAVLAAVLLTAASLLFPIYGIAATGRVYGVLAACMVVGHFIMLRRLLPEFSTSAWIAAFGRPIAATAAMIAITQPLDAMVLAQMTLGAGLPRLVLALLVAGSVYLSTLFGLWIASGRPDGQEKLVVQYVQSKKGFFVSLLKRRTKGNIQP